MRISTACSTNISLIICHTYVAFIVPSLSKPHNSVVYGSTSIDHLTN